VIKGDLRQLVKPIKIFGVIEFFLDVGDNGRSVDRNAIREVRTRTKS
jgi:hypothetical protein